MSNKTNADALFDKLNQIPAANKTPQKTIPVITSKRENQSQTGIWLDNSIIKRLKRIALDEETTVTDLLAAGALEQIRSRYPNFEIGDV